MVNKLLQRQRMMRYFIDACKDIILEEGYEKISAKKVGDRAGYSYATIYNYFRNMDELILYCINDFLEECSVKVENSLDEKKTIIDQLMETTDAYIDYFFEKSVRFKIIFMSKNKIKSYEDWPKEIRDDLATPKVVKIFSRLIKQHMKNSKKNDKTHELVCEICANFLFGEMFSYFFHGAVMDQEEFKKLIHEGYLYILSV